MPELAKYESDYKSNTAREYLMWLIFFLVHSGNDGAPSRVGPLITSMRLILFENNLDGFMKSSIFYSLLFNFCFSSRCRLDFKIV